MGVLGAVFFQEIRQGFKKQIPDGFILFEGNKLQPLDAGGINMLQI
jgi:hypothetical protein